MKRMTMSREKIDEGYLLDLLKESKDLDVPDGLEQKVMQELSGVEPKKSIGLFDRLKHSGFFQFRPLNLAMTLTVAVAAFLIGYMLNSDDRLPLEGAEQISTDSFSDNAMANYLVGRGLLAGNQAESALQFLQKAVELEPEKPEFTHWQGIAFWALGSPEMERQSYVQSIKDDPEYLPSLLYLGHNYLESGDYSSALKQYQHALQQDPQNPEALYNSALALKQLNDKDQGIDAFKRYLSLYRTGKWAYRAVLHLNQLGDFSFRSYLIGKQKVVLHMEALLDPQSAAYKSEMATLVQALGNTAGQELHMVVFINSDKTAARAAALDLRHQLIEQLGPQHGVPVRISWFDAVETISVAENSQKKLSPSLLIFTKSISSEEGRDST